jgi:hypothetical protein
MERQRPARGQSRHRGIRVGKGRRRPGASIEETRPPQQSYRGGIVAGAEASWGFVLGRHDLPATDSLGRWRPEKQRHWLESGEVDED